MAREKSPARLAGLKSVRMLSDGSLRLTFSIAGHAATRTEIVHPDSAIYQRVMRIIGSLTPGQIFLFEPLNGYQKLPPDPLAPLDRCI